MSRIDDMVSPMSWDDVSSEESNNATFLRALSAAFQERGDVSVCGNGINKSTISGDRLDLSGSSLVSLCSGVAATPANYYNHTKFVDGVLTGAGDSALEAAPVWTWQDVLAALGDSTLIYPQKHFHNRAINDACAKQNKAIANLLRNPYRTPDVNFVSESQGPWRFAAAESATSYADAYAKLEASFSSGWYFVAELTAQLYNEGNFIFFATDVPYLVFKVVAVGPVSGTLHLVENIGYDETTGEAVTVDFYPEDGDVITLSPCQDGVTEGNLSIGFESNGWEIQDAGGGYCLYAYAAPGVAHDKFVRIWQSGVYMWIGYLAGDDDRAPTGYYLPGGGGDCLSNYSVYDFGQVSGSERYRASYCESTYTLTLNFTSSENLRLAQSNPALIIEGRWQNAILNSVYDSSLSSWTTTNPTTADLAGRYHGEWYNSGDVYAAANVVSYGTTATLTLHSGVGAIPPLLSTTQGSASGFGWNQADSGRGFRWGHAPWNFGFKDW